MKPLKTYIIVASEKAARLLENDGVGKGVYQFTHITIEDSGVMHHEFADEPTKTQLAHGPTSGVDPRTSVDVENRESFAKYLAELAEAAFRSGDYDRLVIVAGPKMLGELRKALAGKVDVYAELDKDLINTPTDEMAKHLATILAV